MKESLTQKDLSVTQHMTDGFTLACMFNGERHHKRYIGWKTRDAKRDFVKEVKATASIPR